MSDAIQFFEEVSLAESQIDKENLIIRNVVVLTKNSKNKRQYSDQALTEAATVLKNAPSYFNHAPKRDVRDLLGQFSEMRRDGDKVRGDLQLLENSKWLLDVASRTPSAVGFSINALGRTKKESEVEIVESIVKAISIDLVADPATTKSIFEGIEMAQEEKIKQITEENQKLAESNKKLQEEYQKLLEKNKRVELKELATKELPIYAVTESFIDILVKVEKPEILIKERAQLIEEVKKALVIKGGNTTSSMSGTQNTVEIKEEIKKALKG